ncbi:hypothetical protein ALC56_08908 [Trachymyrmex septentrionalis]|uniref:Uncharacterized protein n=1 Tax=Trachymyrmex septentrionalis TaxID=34720 RepID=A0A195FA80_9HYME|nr:hypothetical protein ALC56_08908 [Trachymyrmex septentrionalis]
MPVVAESRRRRPSDLAGAVHRGLHWSSNKNARTTPLAGIIFRNSCGAREIRNQIALASKDVEVLENRKKFNNMQI